LVKVPNRATVRKSCRENLKIQDEDVEEVIAEARRRLTLATDYHRDEELGKAILRYENLYSDCYKIKDYKTALNAEHRRTTLLGLHKPQTGMEGETSEESGLAQTIRDHLEPLRLAPEETPVEELVRLAALEVIRVKAFMQTYAANQPRPAPGENADTEPGEVGEGSGDCTAPADPEPGAADTGDV
jgi:hypothetical protein